MLDFSADINPLGPPPCVRTVITRHLEEIQRYPDPEAQALREAIAEFHQIPVDTVLPGNGAAELISLLGRLRPMTKAVIVVPTFSEYAWVTEHGGGTVEEILTHEQNQFALEVGEDPWGDRLADAEVVFLCNPNNPTGTVVPRAEVLRIAERCRQAGALFVVDEAFVDFTERPEQVSILPDALQQYDHVVVLRSLTKSFAIPGLRLGYLVAHETLVQALRALQPPWPLNTFALAVGAQLFKETAYLRQSRDLLARWREQFRGLLQIVPMLTAFPSHANFFLCKLPMARQTSAELTQQLAARGLLIRNCDTFRGLEPGRFIRLAVRMPDENARLARALQEALTHAG